MGERLEEVLEEVSIIREEWGYPVMITPFSQLVGTQAVINRLTGERYKTAPTENIRYLLGHYGQPPAPVDQNVLDKVTSLPEAKPYLNWEEPQPGIAELRKEMGRPRISDDELLLRLLFAEEHVEATLKAGPIQTEYPRGDRPLMALLKELTRRTDLGRVRIEKGDLKVELGRRA
jgi:oxaloacetate decarboxylase alpha subunit